MVFVVNPEGRADRRAWMERILPTAWDVEYTSDWDCPVGGQTVEHADVRDFRFANWQIESDDPRWNRPLLQGEIGRAISHWMCWNAAAITPARATLFLEDDIAFANDVEPRIVAWIDVLTRLDPAWDLVYVGRCPHGPDEPFAAGIRRPGYSPCTFGYALSANGLAKVLDARFEEALIPAEEFLPALSVEHPRDDVRCLYPPRLAAYALEPPLVTQLPNDQAGSDTAATALTSFVRP